jgi:hypothetical protein
MLDPGRGTARWQVTLPPCQVAKRRGELNRSRSAVSLLVRCAANPLRMPRFLKGGEK